MNGYIAFFLLCVVCCLVPSSFCLAGDEPFIYPSNSGGTGLMEIPTARIMRENTFRIGYSQIKPYRYYYGAISPFEGLEIDGGITEVMGVPGFPGSSSESQYGNYKDKVLGFKIKIIPEGKYIPAVALGIRDPQGTRLYSSQYIVASKQIYPFDFTLGFGNGRFGIKPLPSLGERIRIEMFQDTKQWLLDSQFFWGVQFAPSEKYALMVEYSPIQYHKHTSDPAQPKYFREPVPSNYNFGFRWMPSKWFEIDLSYQRGNQIGVNLSLPFEIGRPMVPIYDHPYKEPLDAKPLTWDKRMRLALFYSDFSDFRIYRIDRSLTIDVQNNKYFYEISALMALLRAIAPMIPEDIEDVTIIFKENGIPMFSFHTTQFDIKELMQGRLTRSEFFKISKFETENLRIAEGVRDVKSEGFFLGYRPNVSLFLNDPSGFWKGSIGILGWAGYVPWNGASLVAGAALFPFTNVSSSSQPLSIPVRSDITLYMEKKLIFDKFFFQQIHRFSPDIFIRGTAGILEMQYAGLDSEIAKPFFGGRLLLGVGGSAVKKRDPDNPLLLKKNDAKELYTTLFVNSRLNFPKSGAAIEVKYGHFLAGDRGTRITISKDINGVQLYAWYSITDTSIFNDSSNRGYHDKGIGVRVPMRFFFGKETRMTYEQHVSPWTRDVAQDISHFTPLFDFIGNNTKIMLDKQTKKVY